jgi:hypothetical protein
MSASDAIRYRCSEKRPPWQHPAAECPRRPLLADTRASRPLHERRDVDPSHHGRRSRRRHGDDRRRAARARRLERCGGQLLARVRAHADRCGARRDRARTEWITSPLAPRAPVVRHREPGFRFQTRVTGACPIRTWERLYPRRQSLELSSTGLSVAPGEESASGRTQSS